MSFKFEKLIIWQKSMDFGESIFNLSQNFPKDEGLYKSKNRKYISEENFNKLYNESYSLMNQIIAFRNQIKAEA